MTFIVSYSGVVYQRDLGSDTESAAMRMKTFDPGAGWSKAEPAAEPAK